MKETETVLVRQIREGDEGAFMQLYDESHSDLYRYIYRLGIFDGKAGYAISVMEAHAVFMKYLKLYELQDELGRFDRDGETGQGK